MSLYTMLIPSRTDWQKLRDTNHVPKGATKVSIGDAIEKAHKSYSLKNIATHKKDVEKLIADLITYAASIKKKYPVFEPIVNTKVKKKADDHLKLINDIVTAKTQYPQHYADAAQVWKEVNDNPPKKTMKDLAGKVQSMKGCVDAFALIDDDWAAKRGRVQSLFTLCDGAKTLTAEQKKSVQTILAEVKA
jgi:hypothetical protein